MSNIKSLILGSAAIIAASAGAQAADLPVKAKAVQYVKICSLYGAGFYYIPGTDTCINLDVAAQVDANINSNNYNGPNWNEGTGPAGANAAGSGVFGSGSRNSDYFTTRSRIQLNLDTRTATEYGVVRTYWSSNFEHSTGTGPSAGNLTVDYGFVQFAGFTFGKAVSGFQTPWGAYVHNWTPNWETSVFGSYTRIDYNTNASAGICAAQALQSAKLNGYTCNPDFAIWQVGTRTARTPVRNLTFSGEVMYTNLDQSNTGSQGLVAGNFAGTSAVFKPAGTYDYKDQGIWSGNLRVRRTW